MLRFHEIRELIRIFDRSSLTELEIKHDGFEIELKKESSAAKAEDFTQNSQLERSFNEEQAEPTSNPVVVQPVEELQAAQPQVAATPTVPQENLHAIVSPMVGTFYAAPSPDASPYVQIGSKVNPESVVCIVEAMKLFNEIEAEVSGEIVQILVENGQLVEYGQPLFMVQTK